MLCHNIVGPNVFSDNTMCVTHLGLSNHCWTIISVGDPVPFFTGSQLWLPLINARLPGAVFMNFLYWLLLRPQVLLKRTGSKLLRAIFTGFYWHRLWLPLKRLGSRLRLSNTEYDIYLSICTIGIIISIYLFLIMNR